MDTRSAHSVWTCAFLYVQKSDLQRGALDPSPRRLRIHSVFLFMIDFVFLYLIICLLMIVLLLLPSNIWLRNLHTYIVSHSKYSNR